MKYRAFISYSSKDRLIGQRFHRALERYKIPSLLIGRETSTGIVPRRLVPIFRDRSDLESSGDLSKRIRKALEDSSFLIVLCSPQSASSTWVNTEIQIFKTLGRQLNIVPVLVSGAPTEFKSIYTPLGAFPPALFRIGNSDGGSTGKDAPEPFAPDLRELNSDGTGGDGFEYALLKVVSRLIAVPLHELSQRQTEVEKRDRRKFALISAIMSMLAVVATGGGWIAWQKNLEAQDRLGGSISMAASQVEAAVEYRDRYGVPGPVIQELLDSAQDNFSDLITDVGETPRLKLQRAQLDLNFANLYEVTGDAKARSEMIKNADNRLNLLEKRSQGWLGTLKTGLKLESKITLEEIAEERIRYFDVHAIEAIFNDEARIAIDSTMQCLALAEYWLEVSERSEVWTRDLAQCHLLKAFVHYQLGELATAQVHSEKGIKILLTTSGEERNDLVEAYSNLATTLLERDMRDSALGYQQKAVKVARQILDMKNTESLRSMVIVLTRLGDMRLSVSLDAQLAIDSYNESREIATRLTKIDPLRVDWARDLFIVLERVGSAYLQLNETESATSAYFDSLRIIDALLERDVDNNEYLRDKTIVEEGMGQLYLLRNKQSENIDTKRDYLEQSRDYFTSSTAGRKHLLSLDLEDVIAAHDLAIALRLLGTAEHKLGIPSALGRLDEAFGILSNLVVDPHAPPAWYRDIAAVHLARGDWYKDIPMINKARVEYESALQLVAQLHRDLPNVKQYKQDYAELTLMLVKLKD